MGTKLLMFASRWLKICEPARMRFNYDLSHRLLLMFQNRDKFPSRSIRKIVCNYRELLSKKKNSFVCQGFLFLVRTANNPGFLETTPITFFINRWDFQADQNTYEIMPRRQTRLHLRCKLRQPWRSISHDGSAGGGGHVATDFITKDQRSSVLFSKKKEFHFNLFFSFFLF